MNTLEFDFIVIGGGCVGSSIFKSMSQSGIGSVALLDQGRHTSSATASSAGMIRVFHENPEHVELALGHFARMQKNDKDQNGSLYFFDKARFPEYRQSLNKMEKVSYPFEILDTRQGKIHFPDFTWKKNEWAVFEPLATQDNPKRFSDNLLEEGRNNGAVVCDNFEVRGIRAYQDRYRICGHDKTFIAKSLILAGGASFIPRFKDLGLSLPLEEKEITFYQASKTDQKFIQPNFFNRETLEFGCLGNNDSVFLSTTDCLQLKTQKWETDFTRVKAKDCYAPHRQGILGRVPGHSNLFLATGWGGTAFKFSLEIGSRLTSMIENSFTTKGV